MAEVLDAQPPAARDVLLSTSILEQVSAQAASELSGNEQAPAILPAVAHANGFVQPTSSGYRYHPLFAEVLRLKLSREYPDRRAALHRRAARWYERNGQLTEAVRHAADTGDWPLAASIVIDHLAIGEIIEPRRSPSMAGEFGRIPHDQGWTEPQPHLVSAAVALSAGRHEASAAALDAAEAILERRPADQEVPGRLAAAMIRLAASLRGGDLAAAAAAAARAEALASRIPGDTLARHPDIRARVLSGRGAVELWSGHLDEAAGVLESGVAAATACGGQNKPADCLGHLALTEALRGRLRRAATVADQATAARTAGQQRPPDPHPSPAALVALAWVHLEHYELREAHSRLTQADAALGADRDQLIAAAAWLAAAYGALAEGRAAAAAQSVDAQLSYTSGDPPRGRRSLTSALRLAEPEQLRLPFVLERSWIGPVLRRDPELAQAHRHLLAPTLRHDQLPAPRAAPEQAASPAAEPLSERERQVLRHVSRMLTTPEVASEMHISTHTVKTHIQNICRKLAVTRRAEAVRRARQLELI